MNNKVVRVFFNVNMSAQHFGLYNVAMAEKINLNALRQGEHAVFINKKCNRIKVYSSNGCLSYMKRDKGIDLGIIQMIAQSFSESGELSFTKAEKLSLEKKLKKLDVWGKPDVKQNYGKQSSSPLPKGRSKENSELSV